MQRLAIAGTTMGLSFGLAFAAVAKAPDHGTLSINPNGHVQLRGVVSKVDLPGKMLGVKVWGMEWTVKITDATKLQPRPQRGTITLDDIKVGHVVLVNGPTSAETPLTLTAKRVIDKDVRPVRLSVFDGKVNALAPPDAFTLQIRRGGQLTVKVTADTKIWRSETAQSFADLLLGATVKVRGTYDKATNTLVAADIRIVPKESDD
jgi:hypothetical protein